MEKVKKILKEIFIDGFSGLAMGIFPTLIIGVILSQIGTLTGGRIGELLLIVGKIASSLTGVGIGIGVALKFKSNLYVIGGAAVAGMIGAFASKILQGSLYVNGTVILPGAGDPLGTFIAAYVGIKFGQLVSGKTSLDLLITPAVIILVGGAIGLLVGPPISGFMTFLGSIINWAVEQQPIIMGIVVALVMGMTLTGPISAAALSMMLNLSGLAAGAAMVGGAANMIGFAVASFKDNKWGGVIAQGLGSSKLQVSNALKKPVIWLPAIITSVILGPLSTTVFHILNNSVGGGMGNAGFVGPIMALQTMSENESVWIILIKLALINFILPAILAWGISAFMRKRNWIKDGDMKLEL